MNKGWHVHRDTRLHLKCHNIFVFYVLNVFVVKPSIDDSWILPPNKDDWNWLGRRRKSSAVRGGEWTAEVAHSLGRHLLMRHLLGRDFLPSETAFSRPRPWLRSAPAAGPWLDPFHIFPCDSYHGQWCKYTASIKTRSNCRWKSFWLWLGLLGLSGHDHQMDYKKDILLRELKIFTHFIKLWR